MDTSVSTASADDSSSSSNTEVPQHVQDLVYQQHEDDEDDDFSDEDDDDFEQESLPQVLRLDLRGTRVDLDRDTLVNLPESLLIAMFPQGLVLGGNDEDEIIFVDFDPACLDYVLACYKRASSCFSPQQQYSYYHPLLSHRQPVIVLREELEYFCVPFKKLSMVDMAQLKMACGDLVRRQDAIFEALEKNIARDKNTAAEQHLIDMLCDAGFKREDRWGHRALEPMRTCVTSTSLVLIDMTEKVATAQKLLLFWKKPAVS